MIMKNADLMPFPLDFDIQMGNILELLRITIGGLLLKIMLTMLLFADCIQI